MHKRKKVGITSLYDAMSVRESGNDRGKAVPEPDGTSWLSFVTSAQYNKEGSDWPLI